MVSLSVENSRYEANILNCLAKRFESELFKFML